MVKSLLGIFFIIATVSAQKDKSEVFEINWRLGEDFEAVRETSMVKYHLGDQVVFKYEAGEHNVIEVDEKSYKNCNAPPSAKVMATGQDVINITFPGRRYFICGIGNHCKEGMKVEIEIRAPFAWTHHFVGGDKGWTTNVDYQAWAADRKFDVGDMLLFRYKKDEHNVFKVDESAYKKCTIPNSNDSAYITGNDGISLVAPGGAWFISGVGKDCENGMKLFVNVLPAEKQPKPPGFELQGGRKLVPQS